MNPVSFFGTSLVNGRLLSWKQVFSFIARWFKNKNSCNVEFPEKSGFLLTFHENSLFVIFTDRLH